MIIIGVTGTFAAGKDTISEYLQKKGFFHFSLSDAIRREAEKRGLPKDRDTLQKLGVELGEKFGNDVLAKRAVEAVREAGVSKAVFTSLRRPAEIDFLRKLPGFTLIAVDAPIKTRYERVVKRQREGDEVDFDKFKAQEDLERSGTGSQQNLDGVAALAERVIQNDGTFEQLYKKIDELIEKNEG